MEEKSGAAGRDREIFARKTTHARLREGLKDSVVCFRCDDLKGLFSFHAPVTKHIVYLSWSTP